jgi:transposase
MIDELHIELHVTHRTAIDELEPLETSPADLREATLRYVAIMNAFARRIESGLRDGNVAVAASLELIDDLERQIAQINTELRAGGADHPYVPLLLTVPGIGWVLAFTIAAEIGDITRFPSPKKLCGYTGLCPRVHQSGERDRRGPLTKQGPKYLRWAMLEATMHALRHPAYNERYQRNKQRLGKQRGAKVAQIDVARKLTEAIWHMLTNNESFAPTTAPRGAAFRLAA